MAKASDRFRKVKAEPKEIIPPALVPTAEEKAKALDELFGKINPHAQEIAKTIEAPTEPKEKAHGVELFSTFGGGSIIIEGKDTPLPVLITSPVLLLELRAKYNIDTSSSIIRSRQV